MSVMIDGFNLSLHKGTGIATYSRNLSYALSHLGHSVDVLYGERRSPRSLALMREIAFFDDNVGALPKWLRALGMGYRTLRSPLYRRPDAVPLTGTVEIRQFLDKLPFFDRLWNAPNIFSHAFMFNQLTGGMLRIKPPGGTSAMHWTSLVPARAIGVPNIYTVHDLIPLRLPYTTLDNKDKFYRMTQRIIKCADGIITVSDNSARDIISIFPEAEPKLRVTYQSSRIPAKLLMSPRSEIDRDVENLLPVKAGKYFLFFGSIEPKKNIGRLVEAFLAAHTDHKLIIVGAQAWKAEEELRLLNHANYLRWESSGTTMREDRRIVTVEYLTFSRLVSLIRCAKAVVFPSLYEGFGLPVLEALQCGTRVITSDTSSIPEVGGTLATYVDPYDIRDIKIALERLSLEERAGPVFAAAAHDFVRKFSVDAHAERLQAAYDAYGVRRPPARPVTQVLAPAGQAPALSEVAA